MTPNNNGYQWDKQTLILDIPTALAKTATTCDYCGTKLGEHYASDRKFNSTAEVHLKKDIFGPETTSDGTSIYATHHYCGEGCLREHLNERHQEADACMNDNMSYGAESAAAISYKDRKKIKSTQFLYPETRSFPVRNCQDVKHAARAFGRGKNSDSYATFMEKLKRKASELGCESSLPKTVTQK